ncbi:UNVERIFIED_CONTAM: IclR family transcriptional regulator [Halobacillus marinus]
MTVKSADRVISILDHLKDYPNGLSLKEIAAQLALPQSSTFQLLQTMQKRHFLTVAEGKVYKLGPKLVQIGTRALETLDVYADARPYLRELMEKVEETVFMAMMIEEELVYVAKFDNYRSIRTTAQIGMRKPLYCTGLGKAFLAFMPEPVSDHLLSNMKMEPITSKTLTDPHVLKEQFAGFREQGFAIDDEENEVGLYCLAAPIYNAAGEMVAAISTAGPKTRVLGRYEFVSESLLTVSKAISERNGYVL